MQYGKVKHELGFYHLDPIPTIEELKAYYSEQYYQDCTSKSYSPDYLPEELKFFYNRSYVSNHIYKELKGNRVGTFYDVGCGEGFFADYFVKNGWEVELCDFSAFGVQKHNPALMECFEKGDVLEILKDKIKTNSKYDFINLSYVLEHVRHPVQLIDDMKSLMHENSVLRVEVPNDFSKFQLYLQDQGMTKEHWFGPPDHINYFTFASLKNVLHSSGFKVLKILSDFPIDVYLHNSFSNYFHNKVAGKQAHLSRVCITNFLIDQGVEKYVNYMSAAADLEFGRGAIMFVCLDDKKDKGNTDL